MFPRLGADGFNVLTGPASNMSAHVCGQDSEGEIGPPDRALALVWSYGRFFFFAAHVNVYRF